MSLRLSMNTYDQQRSNELHIRSQMEETATVLPKPVASAVSLATRSSSVYLRLGTLIGRFAIDSARVTTVTSLEVGRAVLERVLFKAGDDVARRSTGDLGRQEAEGLLERSISTLHSTITSISFAAATGFHISTTSLSAASDLSQQLLATLDSIFGSTDSSRAIASIVTLVRREFQNPATGQPGEKVSLKDLLAAVVGLALLQRWCKVASDQEAYARNYKDVVWDVVILDDGRRADVAESKERGLEVDDEGQDVSAVALQQPHETEPQKDEIDSSMVVVQAEPSGNDDSLEIAMRDRIMASLPPDSTVTISSETTTTKVITVEITGAHPPEPPVPSDAEVVEENVHFGDYRILSEGEDSDDEGTLSVPAYRVVYRTSHTQSRGTDVSATKMTTTSNNPDEPDYQKDIENVVALATQRPNVEYPKRLEELGIKQPLPNLQISDKSEPTPRKPSGSGNSPNTKRTRTAAQPSAKAARPSSRAKEDALVMKSSNRQTGSHPVISNNNTKERKTQSININSNQQGDGTYSEMANRNAKGKGGFMNALRKAPQATFSSIMGKNTSSTTMSSRPPWGSPAAGNSRQVVKQQHYSRRQESVDETFYNKDLPRPPSSTSFYEMRHSRRDSIVSQTDTYSIHSAASTRPSSPVETRTHVRTQSAMLRTKSERYLEPEARPQPISRSHSQHGSIHQHRVSKSYDPSIFTLKTSPSQTSLSLYRPRKSAYDDEEAVQMLQNSGEIPGLFPQHHFIRNITRFVRFASASYGSSFMRLMGISKTPSGKDAIPDPSHHYEHHSYSSHTQLPTSTILLSSFVDPQGGTDKTGETGTNVPLVHFISLDHDSKAVVLSCRGTMGFEDVLTDMTCDYADMILGRKTYRVHKGIYASARRLLFGNECRVMATLAAALEEFPTYGLVMCGHSLGGGVVSLLAIMLSMPGPDPNLNAFVTAPSSSYPSSPLLLTSSPGMPGTAPCATVLPAGRPIHVYAYGPPATLSPSLRLVTRGLITTIVNKNDLVPYLSLGTLHDLQAVALAFKTDSSGASSRVRARVWESLRSGLLEQWYRGDYSDPHHSSEEDDQWAWATLKTLRASMQSEKLVPPGEVFQVETTRVLQRNAFTAREKRGLGRPATRAVLRYVRDVEAVFAEVQFKGGMLGDHSPGRYENSLKALATGVLNVVG